MIGLKKGVMNCEGVSLHKEWIITYRTKTIVKTYNIWEVFDYILSNMSCWCEDLRVRMYIGNGHLFLKSRYNPCSGGIDVDRIQIKRLLYGETVTDPYVKRVGLYFDAFTRQMSGKYMRLQTDMTKFCLMSTEYFEYLKSIEQEKYIGLYSDSQGFCRLDFVRQRNVCKVGQKNQCIFMTTLFEEGENGISRKRNVCGKFSEKFATQKFAEHSAGMYKCRIVGTCESLRGFEI